MRTITVFLAVLASACGHGTGMLRGPDGALAPCEAQRCVSSLERGTAYYVEPLRYGTSREQAHAQLLEVLRNLPRTRIIVAEPDYIHAEASTATLRYVDDLEFVFAEPGVIHVRSSARFGYYDFSANRDRVDLIRAMFTGRR
jgi:uncharacterized protein (DUF1499 family)